MPKPLTGLTAAAQPNARVLILGSMPGAASLAQQQYYAHPRNAFWPLMAQLAGIAPTLPYPDRVTALNSRGIALWDVIASCQRSGSLDSAIEEGELNDLAGLIQRVPTLRAIAHNGGESARHMRVTQALGLPVFKLPSTSPAHASWSFERKLAAWREVFAQAGLLD